MTLAIAPRDYSLVGTETKSAEEKGLVGADWYTCSVSRKKMKELMQRRDGPAIRDTLIWFAALLISGSLAYLAWGTWWAIPAFMVYGVLYSSVSDSRWHECGHGTAFKTPWMNDVIYQMATFMVLRQPAPWRWSHTRHHSDTIIVGRDPEIAVPRPPDLIGTVLNFFYLKSGPAELSKIIRHCFGRLSEAEKTYIPEAERKGVYWVSRIHILIHLSVIAWSIAIGSILPWMFIGLPSFYGAWLMSVTGLTQHAGLAEDVLDHRLNCRTVYMNPLLRFLYWNMNYHLEHHMFPMVPYHALPRLHEAIKEETPRPYNGLWETYSEIIPALWRQRKDPSYFVKRELPHSAQSFTSSTQQAGMTSGQWIEACRVDAIDEEDVIRFDHGARTYAIYRGKEQNFYASDGLCTHGKVHLAGGLVIGNLIECPKHNGRFDYCTGEVKRKPVCVNLKTYPVKIEGGKVFFNPSI